MKKEKEGINTEGAEFGHGGHGKEIGAIGANFDVDFLDTGKSACAI